VRKRVRLARIGSDEEHRRVERAGERRGDEVVAGLGVSQDRPGALDQEPFERLRADQVVEESRQVQDRRPEVASRNTKRPRRDPAGLASVYRRPVRAVVRNAFVARNAFEPGTSRCGSTDGEARRP
jgi:hypothetical protein